MTLGIGIDTGGTYTDAVIYDFDKKEVVAKNKSLTTKGNLEIGIGNSIDGLPSDLVKMATILSLSTTLATNACVEKKGGRAKLVLLGTSNKVLEWVDAKTKYGLNNDDVLCIDSKSSFDGNIIDNPDWNILMEQENEWFSDSHALAIAEVNASRNGASCEKLGKEKLMEKYSVPIIMAHELANDLNIMERGATALLNAKLLPIIDEFLHAVKTAMDQRNINIEKMIVRSDGSLMSEKIAQIHPVKTILSGPAASIIGARGLTDCENCLIIDMGGTTTDISIVKNNVPVMTDGIHIGGFRTQIKGVFIETFGLGGDSRITIDNSSIKLNSRKVQPLCMAAAIYPQIKTELEGLLNSDKKSTSPLYEFLYLVKYPKNINNYNYYEIDLINKLKDHPVMLGSNEIDLYNLKSERLEDEEVIMRCGLTLTDIMHIKGDFSLYDYTASILGAKYLLKVLPDYKDNDDDLKRLCDNIYDLACKKLYKNVVKVMLMNSYPKIFKKGISKQVSDLINNSWHDSSTNEFFSLKFDTNAVLIGIGAPTHIFLPKVAKTLGTDYIIPEHAQVANAIGAIIADISASSKIEITPNYETSGINGYTVYNIDDKKHFDKIDDAIEYAKVSAQNNAIKDAKSFGALGELQIDVIVNPSSAYSVEGISIDLGTTVIANVTGRL